MISKLVGRNDVDCVEPGPGAILVSQVSHAYTGF